MWNIKHSKVIHVIILNTSKPHQHYDKAVTHKTEQHHIGPNITKSTGPILITHLIAGLVGLGEKLGLNSGGLFGDQCLNEPSLDFPS